MNAATVLNWEKGKTEVPGEELSGHYRVSRLRPLPAARLHAGAAEGQAAGIGWSIRKAARQLDVDPASLGNWEHGGLILYREHRTRIAGLLGIREAELDQDMARTLGEKHVRPSPTRGAWKAKQERQERTPASSAISLRVHRHNFLLDRSQSGISMEQHPR